jgi:hypothetical protein
LPNRLRCIGEGNRGAAGVNVAIDSIRVAACWVPSGYDGTPKPFLMILEWIKVGKDWKVASEIILPILAAVAVSNN